MSSPFYSSINEDLHIRTQQRSEFNDLNIGYLLKKNLGICLAILFTFLGLGH